MLTALGLAQESPRLGTGHNVSHELPSFGMVKELVALGLKGRALREEVMGLTGLPAPDAQLLINVELTGKGDTDPPLGPAPDLSHILNREDGS